jgi:acyl-CoA synthetase (AMP-forming)/AMP-acid ligase II
MSLFSLLDRTAHQWPDAGAVYLGHDLWQTWWQLRARALTLAHRLHTTLAPASRIAIASENCPHYLELMFGTWAAQHAVVPINYKLHAREMAQIVSDADPAWIVVSPNLADDLKSALEPAFQSRVCVIGSPAYEQMFGEAAFAPPVSSPEALAWLFYTSGTTGRSKGAMLSQRNLMAMTVSHLADVESLDEHCSQIHAAPMSHGSGMYIPAYVARGARQVIPASGGFDPDEFLQLCGQHPGVGAFLAPTMVQRLRLALPANQQPPAGLRSIVYGGGPMYVQELKQSLTALGQVFTQIYGQGESPMTITWLRRADHASHDDAVLGSVGVSRTGVEVRVVDDSGQDVSTGEIGEIIVRGDVVMSGYWRNPSGSAEALREGWLYTGDMGSRDERGYITLRDRSKDVVISGGSNIYPREVEEALLKHPGVSEVSVVGQRDEEWGEVVVAFVVPTPGTTLDSATLDAHCLEHIARFKRPKRYVMLEALPKNSYGKVLKRSLRDLLITDPP